MDFPAVAHVAHLDAALPACLRQLLCRIGDDVRQAYQDALSQHLEERLRLTAEVARLRAESSEKVGAPMAADNADGEEHNWTVFAVVQPPATVRVAPFFTRESCEVQNPEALCLEANSDKAAHDGRWAGGVEFHAVDISPMADDDADARQDFSPKSFAPSDTWGRCETDRSKVRSDSKTLTQMPSLASVYTNQSAQAAHRRLQMRLGHLRGRGVISGRDLHQTLSALGLERYSVKEMDALIHQLSSAISVRVRTEPGNIQAPRAEWRWPDATELEGNGARSSFLIRSMTRGGSTANLLASDDGNHSDKVLPWKALMELFFKDEMYLEKLLGPAAMDQVFAIREVLLTGEANRIISELTCVRIDDLATRRQRLAPSVLMDPVVGAMIIINGLAIGMSMEEDFRAWEGWTWIEVFFTSFFALEIVIRQVLEGYRTYFFGPERLWNYSDIVLVGIGALSCIIELLGVASVPSPAVLRFFRVVRFSRLVRVFRLNFMLELRLMVKGVVSGLRTLFWASVLLAFVLYALGVATATFFQDCDDEIVQEMFGSVPHAMFTAFECVTGECLGKDGIPLTWRLFHIYGVPFGISFAATYILISLGLFNVILAIYVDVTMVAAKQTEDATKGHNKSERIRVAQVTKRLLKMFCAAYHFYNRLPASERHNADLRDVLHDATAQDVDLDHDINISKELFLLVVQDPEVKRLMDDLDIPPDRDNLFDCIDADGSGRLQATELVRGFLKVRGEAKKTDQAACILVLRSVQGTLKRLGDTMDEQRRALEGLRESQFHGRPRCIMGAAPAEGPLG